MSNGDLDGGLPTGGTDPGSNTGTDTSTDADGSTGSGADDNANADPGIPFSLPASVNGFAAARSAAATNTIGVANCEPVVTPPVNIWKGYSQPWQSLWMRPPNCRNQLPTLTWKDDWNSNGCHPTSLAMILHWWHVTNQETSGQLTFPYSPPYTLVDAPPVSVPAGEPEESITPLELCRRLFSSVYPPAVLDGEWKVNHIALTGAVKGISIPGPTGSPQSMTYVKYATQGSAQSDIKSAITYLLQLGPILIELVQFAHIVLVCGYRKDIMYICDSGDIVNNRKGTDARWSQSPGMKFNDVYNLGVPSQNLVAVNCKRSDFTYNGGDKVTWWSNIKAIEAFFFDETNIHSYWSQTPDPVLANPP